MTCVYELTPAGELHPGPGHAPAGGGCRWVRLVDASRERLGAALHELGLPDDVLQTGLAPDSTDPLANRGDALVVTLPVMAPSGERIVALRAACDPTTLVTVEEAALPGIDAFLTSRCARADAQTSLPRLFVEVLEAAVAGSRRVYLALRRETDALSEALERDALSVPADDLQSLKSRVTTLSRLWDEQSHTFLELQRRHGFFTHDDHTRGILRDLATDAGHGVKLLGHLDSRLRDLRQLQTDRLHDSTNRRLNMLAVLSAIYMPATLIAGVYGMNFKDIPVTHLRHGYFIVMAIMAAVVLGQLWYFRRRGWFD